MADFQRVVEELTDAPLKSTLPSIEIPKPSAMRTEPLDPPAPRNLEERSFAEQFGLEDVPELETGPPPGYLGPRAAHYGQLDNAIASVMSAAATAALAGDWAARNLSIPGLLSPEETLTEEQFRSKVGVRDIEYDPRMTDFEAGMRALKYDADVLFSGLEGSAKESISLMILGGLLPSMLDIRSVGIAAGFAAAPALLPIAALGPKGLWAAEMVLKTGSKADSVLSGAVRSVAEATVAWPVFALTEPRFGSTYGFEDFAMDLAVGTTLGTAIDVGVNMRNARKTALTDASAAEILAAEANAQSLLETGDDPGITPADIEETAQHVVDTAQRPVGKPGSADIEMPMTAEQLRQAVIDEFLDESHSSVPREQRLAQRLVDAATNADDARRITQLLFDLGEIDDSDLATMPGRVMEAGQLFAEQGRMDSNAMSFIDAARLGNLPSDIRGDILFGGAEKKMIADAIKVNEGNLHNVLMDLEPAMPLPLRPIARRVIELLRSASDAGWEIGIGHSPASDVAVWGNVRDRVAGVAAFSKGKVANVFLRSTGKYSGMDFGTLLHEAVHIVIRTRNAEEGFGRFDAVDVGLRPLLVHVRNLDPTTHKKIGHYLTSNAFENVEEFVVRALTDPEFAELLDGIEYKNTTLWDALVTAIRDLLGLAKNTHTALSEVLGHTSRFFDEVEDTPTPRRTPESLRVEGNTIAEVESAQALELEADPENAAQTKAFYDRVRNAVDGVRNIAVKCRT